MSPGGPDGPTDASFREATRGPARLVGVVHLLPLPGAPRPGPGLEEVERRAVADARALADGGVDGVIVENLGDAPFAAERVDAATVAAMTRVALAVRQAAPDVELGINVLRNDGLAALGIAHAVGAAFVRVNVLVGVMATDQGLVQGRARELLLHRRALGATGVRILADVLVKHAAPIGPVALDDVARDTWARGGADGLIVSGTGTGRPTDPTHLTVVREAVPAAPLWLGSGLTPERANALRPLVDGAIVGTWLHQAGQLHNPVDPTRVREMVRAWQG